MGQIRTIFRVCGLAVALVLSGAGIAEGAAKGETVWPMGASAFALAFWHNTRPGGGRVWRRRAVGLMAIQLLGGAVVSGDVLILVAMQVPLVLGEARWRLRWMAGMAGWTVFLAWAALAAGEFEPS